jgi:hypothetical protein
MKAVWIIATGAFMKTVLILVLTGALLGVVVASYIVPPALSWYSAPGGLPQGTQIQALVQIPDVIRYATGKLLRGQAIGGGIGAVLGLVAGILLIRRGRARQAAAAPAATTGAGPTPTR